MYKFNIYKKHHGIYWSNTIIIYSIVLPSLLILYLKNNILGFQKNFIDNLLFFCLTISLALGLFLKFSGFVKFKPLKGKLVGQLTLDSELISIESETYKLSEIQKIQIFNFDFYGLFKYTSRGSFEANLSKGIDNSIIITLISGQKVSCQFQQLDSDEMNNCRSELINYFVHDKINFLHLIDILKITDYNDIHQFKKELKISTTANSW